MWSLPLQVRRPGLAWVVQQRCHSHWLGKRGLDEAALTLARRPDCRVDKGKPLSWKQKRKQRKAGDEVDRAFLESQAAADVASWRANQTATLDALFELLFRVLKTCSSSGLIRSESEPAVMSGAHPRLCVSGPGGAGYGWHAA